MPFTVNGIGTTIYGERDYWPDGSFITTEWIVFIYVPIIPIRSQRILEQDNSKSNGLFTSSSYLVYQRTWPNWRQVLCIYSWAAAFVGIALIAVNYDMPYLFVLCLALIGLPVLLRRRAIKRMRDAYAQYVASQQAAGE